MAYKVPEFGKWKTEKNITYTTTFENARKLRNTRAMLDPNDFRELMVSLPENETSTARLSHHTGRSESQSSQLKAAEHRIQESQSNEAYNVNHLDKAQKKKNGTCSGSANAILDQNYKVPEFGNWKNGESISYTASFDKARKVRNSCAMMDRDILHEQPDGFPDSKASAKPPPVRRSEPLVRQSKVAELRVSKAQKAAYAVSFDKAQGKKINSYSATVPIDQICQPKVSQLVAAGKGKGIFRAEESKTTEKPKTKESMVKSTDYQQERNNGGPVQAPFTQNRNDHRGHRSKVPQFGAWDNGDNVGYTNRFETARKTHRDGPTVTNKEHMLNQNINPSKKAPAQAHITKIKPKTEAAQSRKLPQFGAWQGTDEIAYTMLFNNIQKKNKDEFIPLAEPSSTPTEVCSKVPQFGAWEGAETVAYTAYFDNARKNKSVESGQSPLHPRREKLQYEPSTSKNSPTSKIVTSSAWGAGENFKAYCNAIERGWLPSNQSTPRRGNRPRFEPQRHKD